MKQGLSLRVSQHLALTPQLQQSIRLLQLSTLELQQEVEQMLGENPFLELAPEEAPREEFGLSHADTPPPEAEREEAALEAIASTRPLPPRVERVRARRSQPTGTATAASSWCRTTASGAARRRPGRQRFRWRASGADAIDLARGARDRCRTTCTGRRWPCGWRRRTGRRCAS